MPELKTDSPTEAVEMFAIMSPAFDGGEIRIPGYRIRGVRRVLQKLPNPTAPMDRQGCSQLAPRHDCAAPFMQR